MGHIELPHISYISQNEALQKEQFPLSEIALVRALHVPPRVIHNEILLETAFQTSNGRPLYPLLDGSMPKGPIPRATLHFALNDCVSDTSGGEGSWKGADYVVISNLLETLNRNPNSNLVNLLGADTYFEVGLDQQFTLPRGSLLIMPQKNNHSPSRVPQPDHIKTYKANNFSQKDVENLYLDICQSVDGSIEERIKLAKQIIQTNFWHSEENYVIIMGYASINPKSIYPPYPGVFDENGGLDPEFMKYIEQKEIPLDSIYNSYIEMLCKHKSKRDTVRTVLQQEGYQIFPSGDDGWIDHRADAKLKETCNALHIGSTRHTNSIHYALETALFNFQNTGNKDDIVRVLRNQQEDITSTLINLLNFYGINAHVTLEE